MASRPVAERLSCADSCFPKLSHEAAVTVIADLGIRAVDVCIFGVTSNRPETVRRDPDGTARKVAERLRRYALEVADVFLILARTSFGDHAVNHPDAGVRAESLEYFERAVEFAGLVGAPGMTILPGVDFGDRKASLARSAFELQRRAEIAERSGLALSIEPHVESIVETPDETLDLLSRAPDVSIALDYSHFVYQGIPQEEANGLIPRTRHVHLRQASRGKMQAPAREGEIDFGRVLRSLDDGAYEGYLCLEYQWEEWLESNRLDCISETAELRDLLLADPPHPEG